MAVTIKRERPDQRRHHRVTAPLYVIANGVRTPSADWSLGGLRVVDFKGPLPQPNDEIELTLSLPFQGFDISFDVGARIVRTDIATAMFAVEFTQIGERELDLMRHFIDELVRGSMSDAETTIQRIDVPVTPASLKPDANPVSEVPVHRRTIQSIIMSAAYLVLGVFVFGYIGALLFANMYRMEVETAVISAPMEVVAAQAEGRLHWGKTKPGSNVRQGEKILTLYDNKLEQEIEFSNLAIDDRKLQLTYLRRRHVDEIDKVEGFAAIELKNAAQMRLEVDGIREQLITARADYSRHAKLNKKGYSTTAKVEELRQAYITTQKKLASRKLELDLRIRLAEHNLGKRHYTGQNMVGDIERISAEVKRAEGRLILASRKHQALLAHRDRLAIYAPFDGLLMKLPKVDNGHVKKGDILAILEDSAHRQVIAFLKQDEVLHVKLGEKVDIYVPAVDSWLKGQISGIDRTDGFIKQHNRRTESLLNWRESSDRSAKVTVTLLDKEKVRASKVYKSGLPVVIVFKRETTNTFFVASRQWATERWSELPTGRRIKERSAHYLRRWWSRSGKASDALVQKTLHLTQEGALLVDRWRNSATGKRVAAYSTQKLRDWRDYSIDVSKYVFGAVASPNASPSAKTAPGKIAAAAGRQTARAVPGATLLKPATTKPAVLTPAAHGPSAYKPSAPKAAALTALAAPGVMVHGGP